ncbi:MAG TPA: DUF1801 domain-containing protein [Saprospiraceae bacterium]|nr:DUF1801 domain-containing protein [Saprospiraceae bacterium]
MPITAETRKQILDKLKQGLVKCTPPMVVKSDSAEGCELIGNKPVPYGHDKKIIPGMYFASIAQRKDSVAFYFFPSYLDTGLKEVAPNLYKCLKGKSCFHFKKPEQIVEKELTALLKNGVKAWKKMGYLK